MDDSGRPTFREAIAVWVQIALHSFGGPAAQISVMHRILVDENRWLSEKRFLHALNYCMLLPGPEAMQLATYSGWLLHGVRGGLVAGLLFIFPGFVSILALSIAYALYQDTSALGALFFGLKAGVLAIIVQASIGIGKRALRGRLLSVIAMSSFIGLFFFDLPFPLVIAVAGLVGWISGKRNPEIFAAAASDDSLPTPRPRTRQTVATVITWLTIWLLPVAAFFILLGPGHIFTTQAWFFSTTAVVTFGGAYAVLAFIGQQAVENFGWLLPGEMLDGLGMAEATPGPLIQVVQFVGFLGAYRATTGFDPLTAGVLASILVTWVTFAPCFLWIFAGAPYIESLRQKVGLQHALSAITAAVVGVILNLAVWFALHVIFPSLETVNFGPIVFQLPTDWPDWAAVAIAMGAVIALWKFKQNSVLVLAMAIIAGLLVQI